jgi:uroporphyrinogen-III synthase
MTILITRPKKQALVTAEKIVQLGGKHFILPLLKIKSLSVEIPITGYDALIISSQNALTALTGQRSLFNKPVFVVGEHTATLLQELGFTNIKYVAENMELLQIKLAVYTYYKFLYLCGQHVRVDLEKEMGAERVQQLVVYEAEAIQELTAAQIDLIKHEGRTVLFYSARTAQVWQKLCHQYQLKMAGKKAICISTDVAAKIGALMWHAKPLVAEKPSDVEMLKCLKRHIKA